MLLERGLLFSLSRVSFCSWIPCIILAEFMFWHRECNFKIATILNTEQMKKTDRPYRISCLLLFILFSAFPPILLAEEADIEPVNWGYSSVFGSGMLWIRFLTVLMVGSVRICLLFHCLWLNLHSNEKRAGAFISAAIIRRQMRSLPVILKLLVKWNKGSKMLAEQIR